MKTQKIMNKQGNNSIYWIFIFVVAFILGGTGLSILYNANKDTISIIGGFALIGIAIAIIYKLIENE
ncbi:MAG: hypothetical protein AABY22_29700 [Nanoarchaeota archaeon]